MQSFKNRAQFKCGLTEISWYNKSHVSCERPSADIKITDYL